MDSVRPISAVDNLLNTLDMMFVAASVRLKESVKLLVNEEILVVVSARSIAFVNERSNE